MINDLLKLTKLIDKDSSLRSLVRFSQIAEVTDGKITYSVTSFSIGSEDPHAPVLYITGGIHGLERIGAQLAWSLLKTTVDQLIWDKSLRDLFKHLRLVVVPLVNPVGYFNSTRCNGNGVDLMRNSPIRSTEKVPFLLGGHTFSKKLPWYQGEFGKLEIETQSIVDNFQQEASLSSCVIAVDFHSGFGMKDRLWFPFSYTKIPFGDLPEIHALTHLFEQTHPYHIYQIEPQSKGYLLNGDLWDHLYLEFKKKNQAPFIPMTLEMGSWTWVRKNPLQIFSRHGAFNPIKDHRIKRTYRRHHLLFNFLLKALNSHEVWTGFEGSIRHKHQQLGMERWYES